MVLHGLLTSKGLSHTEMGYILDMIQMMYSSMCPDVERGLESVPMIGPYIHYAITIYRKEYITLQVVSSKF